MRGLDIGVAGCGVAGLAAGAMSMGAGEYVSVSTQRDSELALLAKERRELRDEPEEELAELAGIYVEKGLNEQLALEVGCADRPPVDEPGEQMLDIGLGIAVRLDGYLGPFALQVPHLPIDDVFLGSDQGRRRGADQGNTSHGHPPDDRKRRSTARPAPRAPRR